MGGHLTLLWAQNTQWDSPPGSEAETLATGQLWINPGRNVLRLLSACRALVYPSHSALLWFCSGVRPSPNHWA